MRKITFLLLVIALVLAVAFGFYFKGSIQPEVQEPAGFSVAAIANFEEVDARLKLSDQVKQALAVDRFAVMSYGKQDDFAAVYKQLRENKIPLFISADTVLHLYHVFFDETLQNLEEEIFYDGLLRISGELKQAFAEQYQIEENAIKKEALRRNVAYFAVAESLLRDQDLVHFDYVDADIAAELALIKEHKGLATSPLFGYGEDYSQYLPRGHYDNSAKLKSYFQAMMWFGRMSFMLKGGCEECPVSAEVAQRQSFQAMLIAAEIRKREELNVLWKRIFEVSGFFAGAADDFTIEHYLAVLDVVFPEGFDGSFLNDAQWKAFYVEMAQQPLPQIFGGRSLCGSSLTPGTQMQIVEDPQACFESEQGLRLFGQRFVADSYLMSQLVYPFVGRSLANNGVEQFTRIDVEGTSVKGFPRGLEVAALLGSSEAEEILKQEADMLYENYDKQYQDLKSQVAAFTNEDWQRSAYGAWLFSLQSLLGDFGEAYPEFMRSPEWRKKELNAMLASWTALRHDTILYAKQSVTAAVTSFLGDQREDVQITEGYVEPVTDLYGRLLGLTQKTKAVLSAENVLSSEAAVALDKIEVIISKLSSISQRELAFEGLEDADKVFMANFALALEDAVSSARESGTVLIADVHTEPNTGQVLEEGSGYLDLILVAYKLSDGRILLGAGPVLSYYEFKQPMDDRLTDEKWQALLDSGTVARPAWRGL